MKRTIAVLMITVLVLSCVACGSGVTKEQVVGTWVVTEAKGDSDVKNLVGSQMTFENDDTYAWKFMGITIMSGSYRLSGSSLYLDGQRMIINVNDKVMTLKDASGEISLSRK